MKRSTLVPSASQSSTSFSWFTLEKLHNHSALSSPLPMCLTLSLSFLLFPSLSHPFSVLYSGSLPLLPPLSISLYPSLLPPTW